MKTVIDAKLKSFEQGQWLELEAFGITTGMDGARPVMLFREKGGESVLPVWLSPLDAGIALTQHQPQTFTLSPHDVTIKVLKELGIEVEMCRFTELKGHQQYVELTFSGSRTLKKRQARADHAYSTHLIAELSAALAAGGGDAAP